MKYLKRLGKSVKGFKAFISIKESVEYWSKDLDYDDFYDYLRELIDEGFEDIEITKGFVDCINPPKKVEGDPNQLKLFPTDELEIGDDLVGDAESYVDEDEYIVLTGLICPAYKIHIDASDESEGNFTEVLNFFRKIVLSEHRLQTAILVDDEAIDFQYIKIEDGQFHVKQYNGGENLVSLSYDEIDLIVMSVDPVEFKMKDVAEYYGWRHYEVDRDGDIYFKASLSDMASLVCYDSTQESIISGDHSSYITYYEGEYPNTDSLIRYYLTPEAEKMLAMCVIKELGGVKNIDGLEDMTEEEAIHFLTNDNYRKKFVEIAKDFDLCDDLKGLYSNYDADAKMTANYNELFNEFEEVLDKHFDYKYNSEEQEYTIGFKQDWMTSLINDWSYESDYFRNEDPEAIMREWFERESNSEELSARYSEGDVNINKFSAEAIGYMKHYLENRG